MSGERTWKKRVSAQLCPFEVLWRSFLNKNKTNTQKSCDTVPLIICFNQFLVLLGIFAVYFDSERKIGLHINSKKGHFTSTLLFNLFLGL
jgi:low temperature requirement protein LtrA